MTLGVQNYFNKAFRFEKFMIYDIIFEFEIFRSTQMTRKKFRFFMIAFILVSVSALVGIMVQNLNKNKGLGSEIQINDSVLNESMSDGNSDSVSGEEDLEFFVNESAVKKTKTTVNEVTTFIIETKLFVTNNASKVANIDPDAFKISYDTAGAGLLFSVEYGDIEKPIVLEAGQSTAINFVVKYVIQDAESFNDYQKRELKFDYMDKQILVCLV